VWAYEFDPGSNVVDVCVSRLRSKFGFDFIKTVRGAGYRLAGQLPLRAFFMKYGFDRGHPLVIDSGWRQVAEACLAWLNKQGP
jgi:hypothetical protein